MAPPYEAMSYTWDSPALTHELAIDGKLLRTTKKVYIIVNDRSSFWKSRLFWIDFICINQKDEQEKNSQLLLMQDIYRKASRVIVWLGSSPDAGNVPIMLSHLQLLSRLVNSGRYLDLQGSFWLAYQQAQRHRMPALIEFLAEPYWLRVWIVQEIALADTVHILYGRTWISWEDLLPAIEFFLTVNPRSVLQGANHVSVSDRIPDTEISQISTIAKLKRFAHPHNSIPLSRILHVCGRSNATNPRDKIYALLGMISDSLNFIPNPDYAAPVGEVYMGMARYLVQNSNPLLLLHQAGIGYHRALTGLPSWVPDWSKPIQAHPLARGFLGSQADSCRYRATGDSLPPPDVLLGDMLRLEGYRVDAISGVQDSFLEATHDLRANAAKTVRWVTEAQRLASRRDPLALRYGRLRNEAFWRTLIGDRSKSHRPAPMEFVRGYKYWLRRLFQRSGIEFQDSSSFHLAMGSPGNPRLTDSPLRDLLGDSPFQEALYKHSSSIQFEGLLREASFGRKFAVTDTGYMVLVPPGTRVGDTIYAILGTETPFVLRRSERDDAFWLVGESYVQGMMDGERLKQGDTPEQLLTQ
ncbi:MAG: hypothetical protein M1839_005701 [Geoglossum umbratile]|nr:MAG: hypothetical protein M1839_005701 [Geoglossum umbratile]